MTLLFSRPVGPIPDGVSCVHVGVPFSPFAPLSIQTSDRYVPEQLDPPNTISVFVEGSYAELKFRRAGGSDPDGASAIQVETPEVEFASSSTHVSFRHEVLLVAPPKTIMRLLTLSYAAP